MKAPTESALVSACMELLSIRKIFGWRQNQGAIPLASGKGYRAFKGLKGVPDILAALAPTGRLVGIECKMPDGRQSKEQKSFQASLEAAGGAYLLIRDVRVLADCLDDLELAQPSLEADDLLADWRTGRSQG